MRLTQLFFGFSRHHHKFNCWNWRDGVRTALSDDSADAFLAIECVEPERMGDCQAAIDRLAELLERYLGATVVVKTLVTRDNPCVEL